MGPYDELGMTPYGAGLMAMPGAGAAPAPAAPVTPAGGLWGGLEPQTPPPGLAGNPLFMAGLQGMIAANRGDDTAAAMGRGFSNAQQALRTHEAARRGASADNFRRFQMDRLQRAEQQKEQQRAALQSAMAGVPESARSGLPAGLWEAAAADPAIARALVSAQAQAALRPPGTADVGGVLTYTSGPDVGKPVVPGATAPSDWKRLDDDTIFDSTSGQTRSIGGVGTGPARLDRQTIDKAADLYGATAASRERAHDLGRITGDDGATVFERANPLDKPPERAERGAFFDKATARLAPLRKQANAYRRLQIALQEGTSISDIISLYETIKGLDPESVVREGEVALVKSALSMLERLEGTLMKEKGEGFLTPRTRGQLASVSSQIQGALERSAQGAMEDIAARGRATGMPQSVVGEIRPVTFPEMSVWESLQETGGVPAVTTDNPDVEQFVPPEF